MEKWQEEIKKLLYIDASNEEIAPSCKMLSKYFTLFIMIPEGVSFTLSLGHSTYMFLRLQSLYTHIYALHREDLRDWERKGQQKGRNAKENIMPTPHSFLGGMLFLYIVLINLSGLRCIKKLSLQSNRLTSMKGLEECVALEELYLSHNGTAKMEGLSTLANRRVLDVSSNKLAAVEDIEKLTCLDDLWFNGNQLASLDGIAEAVFGSREKLTTIYLEHNPCAKLSNYVTTLREIFPNIDQIDSEVFA
ncbi:protein phosphatase 1 regulatory subunit pprA [Tanacetum coccineum]